MNKFLLSLLLLLSFTSYSQIDSVYKQKLVIKHNLETGLVIGGQITNDNFIYNSGAIVYYTANIPFKEKFFIGGGFAIESFDKETIIPLFANFKASLSKNNRWYIFTDIGGTLVRNKYFASFTKYEYWGGFYYSTGISYQVPVTENISFISNIGLIHQNNWVEYTTIGGSLYKEKVSFNLLNLRVGFKF